MQPTIIVGAGGHAKVVIEMLRQGGQYDPLACVAPHSHDDRTVLDLKIVGDDLILPQLLHAGITHAFVAIGDNSLRRKLGDHLCSLGFELANAISPYASVSPSTRLGVGVAVMPGANIGPDSVVEDGVIVNSGATIDHDCHLGSCCHIGPGASLAGCVHVEELAFVATGACVIPNRRIGRAAIVGAGAAVVRDIPAETVSYGVPARVQRSRKGTKAA